MKWFIIAIILVFLSSFTSALYADVEFTADYSGAVAVTGISNFQGFQLGELNISSNKSSVWLLNYSTEIPFDYYIYTIYLPQDAEITYLKTSQSVRIGSSDRPFIRVTGEDEPITFTVQYVLESKKARIWPFIALGIFVVIIVLSLIYFFKRKSSKRQHILSSLSDRQREIVLLIEKKPRSQKELEAILNLPKSSVSRNVDSLVKQGIIEKHKTGMSNKLKIRTVPPSSA